MLRVPAGFAPDLETNFIDEALLGWDSLNTRLEAHAHELRRAVLQWTGIPMSGEFARTKTLAKAANRRAKKDPVCGGASVHADEGADRHPAASMAIDDLWEWATALRLAWQP